MTELTQYWTFAAICVVVAVVLIRLVLRERLMLQGSLSYVAFLGIIGLMAVFPESSARIAHAMGFSLLSNFFFSVAIGLLALLHLRALVSTSKVHMRSVALTQELAIVQEKLERALAERDARRAADEGKGQSAS